MSQRLTSRIVDLIADQLEKDHQELTRATTEGRTPQISMLPKYVPRAHHHFAKGDNKASFDALVKRIFPHSPTAKADYRKVVSSLSRALDIVEIKMCANRYEEIDMGKIPSLCLKKWTKAFLNEKVNGIPTVEEDETGNRYKDNPGRVKARANLRQAAMDKVHGAQLMPHEITNNFMLGNVNKVSPLQRDVLIAQWRSMRDSVVKSMEEARVRTTIEPGDFLDLGKLVPLVDVSGSMQGIPMEVAIALGILVSELNHPTFRNHFITFDDNPVWVDLSGAKSLAEKVLTTQRAPWGGSTNFEAAMELVLQACIKGNLPQEEVPAMIVFTDMQFNQAMGDHSAQESQIWETHQERITRRFKEHGYTGAPEIIFWNLRGDTGGFPAQADTPGVRMLSGFSPSLLKALLDGKPAEDEVEVTIVEQEDGTMIEVKKKVAVTPYMTLRKVLDDELYDAIKMLLSASAEEALAGYHFQPKENVMVEAWTKVETMKKT